MNSEQQQKEYLNQLRTEAQTQMMQDLMNKITESCFKVCTGQRGDGLDNSEKICLGNCVGRYMDTLKVVHESINSRPN